MKYLSEEVSRALVNEELAFNAAEEAFRSQGQIFPVVIGYGNRSGERFTLKSGSTDTAVGVKIGSYWAANDTHGLSRHGSTIILLNPETGRIMAVVEAASGNAFRTAAADALAVHTLARTDASTLAIIGAGHQAYYEARAVARVRPIQEIFVAGRTLDRAATLAIKLEQNLGITCSAVTIQQAVERADIIATATNSTEALFPAELVRPGTHISAMGADGPGKQELPAELYSNARLFCDVVEQSRTIGEFKNVPESTQITALGEVLGGTASGRLSQDDITVFDSSGFALQDLYFARALLAAHEVSEN